MSSGSMDVFDAIEFLSSDACCQVFCDEESREAIDELFEDPGAYHMVGQIALMGKAFKLIGDALTDNSKKMVMSKLDKDGRHECSGVEFQHRQGSDRTVLDINKIREEYPKEQHPEMYKNQPTNGSVAVTVKPRWKK